MIDNPLNMAIITDWQSHSHVRLERWERDCLFAMDRAFRRSYNDVVAFHAKRKQIKTGNDRDFKRAHG